MTVDMAVETSGFADGFIEKQPFKGYELLACLGMTKNTAIFKAKEAVLGRTVALKIVRPDSRRKDAVDIFFSEARGIARLRLSDIARGLDVGRAGDLFFFAYDYVNGENLGEKLARREKNRLTEKEALFFIYQSAKALQGLFENGQTHRNLKPGNFIIQEKTEIKITDLGFAWALAYPDDESARLAQPYYLSPEIIMEEVNTDIRSDLYSLGCIWFEALLARPVFSALENALVLEKHLSQTPENPRDLEPRLSAASARLILWLLEKERDNRPRTPQDFINQLKNHPLLAVELEKQAKEPNNQYGEDME